MSEANTRILLTSYPKGMPQATDFKIVSEPLGEPGNGEVLCRTIYLSLDPYMRGRMAPVKSYAPPVALGSTIPAAALGEVMASKDPAFNPGDIVQGFGGWQSYWLAPASTLRKIERTSLPISTELSVLGMPALTAYVGLLTYGEPKAGETVFVSAATGAVGSVVGQIAKIKGCRTIGVASTDEKCEFAVQELGYDACLNHRKEGLADAIKRAATSGIDINFENVGGDIFWYVFAQMNLNARGVICGAIAAYNNMRSQQGLDRTAELLTGIVSRRLQLKGLLVSDHFHRIPEFRRDALRWIKDGKLKYREDIVQGIENIIPAFQGLLEGRNFGKLLVQMHEDPTLR